METIVNTLTYSKKLRTRLRELEAERAKATESHKAAVVKWRREIVAWVKANADKAATLQISEPRGYYGDERGLNFNPCHFFHGAPAAPVKPKDDQIRKVRALLRQLAITGQKTIRVSTKDVAEIFGEGKLEDD